MATVTLELDGIEGLTKLEGPINQNSLAGSKFVLPAGFDHTKYASKWEIDGPEVAAARQPVVLQSVGRQAAGWEVWFPPGEEILNEKKESFKPKKFAQSKTPASRVIGKNKYVLLYRPKRLQQAINRIHAADSRRLCNMELNGETNNMANGDPGILTSQDLKRHTRDAGDNPELLPNTLTGNNPDDANTLNLE